MQNCTGAWVATPNPGRTHKHAAWIALFLVGECAVVMRNALTVLVKGLGRKLQKAGITSGHQQSPGGLQRVEDWKKSSVSAMPL